VYARLDRLEPRSGAGEEETTAVLDSIDADLFDRIGREWESLSHPRLATDIERNVSVLELPYQARAAPRELPLDDEDAWLELNLENAGRWPDVLHFLNLFAPPLERSLVGMRRADRPTERDLNRKTSIDLLPEASPSEVDGLLAGVGSPDAAAVYDIGQGACNALIGGGRPTLYFDFGGGVRGNAPSFPPQLRKFCFSFAPPIVLSHWATTTGRRPAATPTPTA
jgi:hypothetical protein